jgi:hypothetical protein
MARILLIACLFAYGNVVACCSVSEGADAGAGGGLIENTLVSVNSVLK